MSRSPNRHAKMAGYANPGYQPSTPHVSTIDLHASNITNTPNRSSSSNNNSRNNSRNNLSIIDLHANNTTTSPSNSKSSRNNISIIDLPATANTNTTALISSSSSSSSSSNSNSNRSSNNNTNNQRNNSSNTSPLIAYNPNSYNAQITAMMDGVSFREATHHHHHNHQSANGQSDHAGHNYNTFSNRIVTKSGMASTGATLSAHNINYRVKVSTRCCRVKVDKQILYNVTGIFKPGMNAILGPTGSGKSSFLDYLAGRLDDNLTTGHLLLDGKPTPKNFKCMVGYVVQDDVVMGTLSVRENFAFSAALRLPKSVSTRERAERVDQVIKELGLCKCADTKVGNEFLRGVSGGERKRCNIGMELIISPPVLFLDEPTTGLDANTANTVLLFLRRIANRGRTIIFSIHQPRFSIYRLFDSLTLLSLGHTVFHGPSTDALRFFQEQGFRCQEHNNPPDFFLDVINGDAMALTGQITDEELDLAEENLDEAQHNKLVEGYRASSWNKRLQSEASAIFSEFESRGGMRGERANTIDYVTSFPTQIGVVGVRAFKNSFRNPQTSVMTVVTSIFFAVLVAAIYWQLDENPETGFKDRAGALFFLIINQMFLNMSAVEIFINERAIFMHENISGFYRVSVYFWVKVFADLLPLRVIPVIILTVIVYFTVDFRPGVAHFFLFVLCLFAISAAATSLCFLISASIRVFAVAQISLAFLYVLMMLFGNFLVTLVSIGPWLNWAQYLSIFKFGLQALYINEFKGRVFCSNTTNCQSGDEYLKEQDMDFEEVWHFWQNIVALFAMTVVYLALTYVQLRRMKKHK